MQSVSGARGSHGGNGRRPLTTRTRRAKRNHATHITAQDGIVETLPERMRSQTMSVTRHRAHVCNCIGCCRSCGHCRTDPRHTHARCDATRDARAQLAAIWK